MTLRFDSLDNIKIKFYPSAAFKSPTFSVKTGVLKVQSFRCVLIVKILSCLSGELC